MKRKSMITMLVIALMLVLSLTVLLSACGKNEDDTPATYSVTVTNGTGGGEYAEGATVKIKANAPETGKEFTSWTINGDAVRLLLNNYLPGDEKILFSALTKLKIDYEDGENWHEAFSAVMVADLKKIPVPKEVYYFIYENSLCSFCRQSALRRLARMKWLTKDISNECLYDSDYEIRS